MNRIEDTLFDAPKRRGSKEGAVTTTKKKKSGQNSKRAKQAQETLARLARIPRKNYHVDELDVGTLRPLVDLAYWSTFLEVRRDAAAAFATLAMNEINLPVLSEAGALGAVIALIGINNDQSDSSIHRDAATALAYLLTIEDVKLRFLKAPDGLRSIFYICRSPSIEVKRAAVKVFANLATIPATKEALVQAGGVKYLFALASTNDEKTKRRAAIVLKRLASHPPNHKAISEDQSAIRCAVSLLIECNDLTIRRDMIHMVISIASTNQRKQALVDNGILTPLLMHMDPGHSSLETITLVLHCMHVLSQCPEVLERMVMEGVVESLRRVIFQELGEIREYRASRRQQQMLRDQDRTTVRVVESKEKTDAGDAAGNETKKSSKIKSMADMEDDALRFGLQILLHISSENDLCVQLMEKEIHTCLYEEAILTSHDKRIQRLTAKILVNLSYNNDKPTPRHEELIESGILYPIRLFLRSTDFELRPLAAKIAGYLAKSDPAKNEFGKHPEILKLIVSLCNPHDEEVNEWVAKFLAELSEERNNFAPIVHSGGVNALIFMISPRSKLKPVRLQAVRALSNISVDTDIKLKLVGSGALGHLISMSKSGTGLAKMYALATLTNLEHDTAAVRIQMVFRGYVSRRMANRKRPKSKEEEFQEAREAIEGELGRFQQDSESKSRDDEDEYNDYNEEKYEGKEEY